MIQDIVKVDTDAEVNTAIQTIDLTFLSDTVQGIEVTDNESFGNAGGFLKKIKFAIKELDAKRKELVDPLNQVVKKINAAFKPKVDALESVQRALEGKMGKWQIEERNRKEKAAAEIRAKELAEMETRKNEYADAAAVTGDEELLKRAEIIEAKQTEEAAREIKAKVTARTEEATTSTRFEWAFEITAPEEISRKYCSPDEKKIRAAVKDGARDIAGVRIYEKAITITR
ncbi:MAG TPA: hypothetical protein VLH56_14415 [Dissulfurispiraceae bacterium]|nr:hypothetical protein [Dissulfurispiraceae bacterium]